MARDLIDFLRICGKRMLEQSNKDEPKKLIHQKYVFKCLLHLMNSGI